MYNNLEMASILFMVGICLMVAAYTGMNVIQNNNLLKNNNNTLFELKNLVADRERDNNYQASGNNCVANTPEHI